MNELAQKNEPDYIEGEFTAEEESGFGCGWCGQGLFVGSSVCSQCHRRFAVPTPSLVRLNQSKHPAKLRVMALVHRGRLISAEIKALKAQNPNAFTSWCRMPVSVTPDAGTPASR